MLFLKLFSLALMGGLAAYCYLNKVDVLMIGSVGGLVVVTWVMVALRFKYLKVMSAST
jgi:membrane-anchored glycerophosphoryl diester phosphodiesterase (GDPDase)